MPTVVRPPLQRFATSWPVVTVMVTIRVFRLLGKIFRAVSPHPLIQCHVTAMMLMPAQSGT